MEVSTLRRGSVKAGISVKQFHVPKRTQETLIQPQRGHMARRHELAIDVHIGRTSEREKSVLRRRAPDFRLRTEQN
jgi:hypothetical protein